MLVLLCSHRKLSCNVLMISVSHGTALPGFRDPLFQIHLPTMFSMQSDLFTTNYSDLTLSSSSTLHLLSNSSWICRNDVFTSLIPNIFNNKLYQIFLSVESCFLLLTWLCIDNGDNILDISLKHAVLLDSIECILNRLETLIEFSFA